MKAAHEHAFPNDDRAWLRRSAEDWYRLRVTVRIAHIVSFVVSLVCVGWPLLNLAAARLGRWWGIDPDRAVRDQPHGAAWLATFLVGLVLVMIVVAAAAVALAVAWLVTVRGWSLRNALEAMVMCRYPRRWMRPEVLDDAA